MKEEVKLSEEQIKERIKEIDLEIEELTRQ
jgi:hypothetical protein